MRPGLNAVDVVWLDSSHQNGWIQEPLPQTNLRCFTRGWLISENAREILVSAHGCVSRDDGPISQFHSPMTIPRVAIVSLRRVSAVRRRKKGKR